MAARPGLTHSKTGDIATAEGDLATAHTVDNRLGVDVLMHRDVKDSVPDPTATATMPSRCSTTEPIAFSKETTACHSMLWLTGCWKIWRSVLR
jgi:hypothetical protein